MALSGSPAGAISISRRIALMPDDTAALPTWPAEPEAQAPALPETDRP